MPFLLPLLLLAGFLRAQEPDTPVAAPQVVRGFVELSPRLVRIHGQTSPLLGAAGLLGLGGAWRAGGAGLFLLERVAVDAGSAFHGSELHMGYGGVLLEWSPDGFPAAGGTTARPALERSARIVVGAGNAELRDAVTGTLVGSDNFVVLEPTLFLETRLLDAVAGGVVGSFRLAVGVDGLGDLDERDLRGWSLGLVLRLGPF